MSRILLVEDGRDIASVLLVHLRNAGHEVEQIEDGAAAIDRILSSPPALTLLDVVLPQIDGLQVLEKVRAHSDHPIIMLTARSHETDRLRGRGPVHTMQGVAKLAKARPSMRVTPCVRPHAQGAQRRGARFSELPFGLLRKGAVCGVARACKAPALLRTVALQSAPLRSNATPCIV
ncbi:response regulator [Variovorax boronicumulans]|uniref:response regulator n=1 Tax=Variovorax boronicumulans TaxID=436515 RepID=UPI00339AAFBA